MAQGCWLSATTIWPYTVVWLVWIILAFDVPVLLLSGFKCRRNVSASDGIINALQVQYCYIRAWVLVRPIVYFQPLYWIRRQKLSFVLATGVSFPQFRVLIGTFLLLLFLSNICPSKVAHHEILPEKAEANLMLVLHQTCHLLLPNPTQCLFLQHTVNVKDSVSKRT